MTFEELIAEANRRGFVLNNCIQLTREIFRVNLRTEDLKASEYADAGTPAKALELCLWRIENGGKLRDIIPQASRASAEPSQGKGLRPKGEKPQVKLSLKDLGL
jgi:hypothetical protein